MALRAVPCLGRTKFRMPRAGPFVPPRKYRTNQKTLYATQQLRGIAGAWWASYIATLPDGHHVPRGKFRTAFRAHHLSAGLLCSKLKEFLDLEQGNRSVFDYMR
jgi:hypothetical protein